MTFVDVLAAFSEGSLPTNEQLLAFLHFIGQVPASSDQDAGPSTSTSSSLAGTTIQNGDTASHTDKSNKGKSLIADLRGLISALEHLIVEKNSEEQVQNLIWNTRGQSLKLEERITAEAAKKRSEDAEARKLRKAEEKKKRKESRRVRREKLKRAGIEVEDTSRKAAGHLLTMGRILLIQPELRHILADFVLLGLEIVDQTVSDTLGPEARKQLGQTVENQRGTVEAIISKAKEVHSNGGLSPEERAKLQQAAMATATEQARLLAGRVGGETISPQMINLNKLKGRVLKTRELIEKKKRGEKIDIELPSFDELRLFLSEEMARGLDVPDDLQQMAEEEEGEQQGMSSDVKAVNGDVSNDEQLAKLEKQVPISDDLPDPSTLVATRANGNGNGLLAQDASGTAPLSRKDVMDLLQLLGVDTALTASTTSVRLAIADAKFRAGEVASKVKVEGAKNARAAWSNQGQARLLSRSRRLLCDVQSAPQAKESLLWFIEGAEAIIRYVAHVTIDVPGRATAAATDAWESIQPGISFLEKFAGGNTVRPIIDLLRHLSIGYREDAALRSFVSDVNLYIRKCVLKEGYVLDQVCESDGRALIERFEQLQVDYRQDCTKLLKMVHEFFAATPQDTAVKEMLRAFRRVGKDLTLGRKHLYMPSAAVWRDLLYEILPPLFNKLDLPIPRIKYTHPDFVLVLENLALNLRELLPNTVDLRITNDFHLDVKHIKSSTHTHSLKLKIKGLGLRIHKVAFALDLLKGVKFHDKGILDLLIENVGLSIYLDVPRDISQHFFTVRRVNGKLSKLRVAVRQSNHAILHKVAELFVDAGPTKLILKKLMAKGVTIGLQQLDVALMELRLNPTRPEDRKRLVVLRRQAAELRDLMVKLREKAGTLEIDFIEKDPTTGEYTAEGGKLARWREETHIYKWVKHQFQQTGVRKIERDQWRSNVFDLVQPADVADKTGRDVAQADPEGLKIQAAKYDTAKAKADQAAHSDSEPAAAAAAAAAAASSRASAKETKAEAAANSKPQGPTTEATVQDAEATLQGQKKKYFGWFSSNTRDKAPSLHTSSSGKDKGKGKGGESQSTVNGAGGGDKVESDAAREMERKGVSTDDQIDALQSSIEQRGQQIDQQQHS